MKYLTINKNLSCSHWSIVQFLALRSSHIHFKMLQNVLFNGHFLIPLVSFFVFYIGVIYNSKKYCLNY